MVRVRTQASRSSPSATASPTPPMPTPASKRTRAAKTVTFTVKNTGKRAGDEIAQVYATLPQQSGEPFKRLAGFERVTLAPGESKTLTIATQPRRPLHLRRAEGSPPTPPRPLQDRSWPILRRNSTPRQPHTPVVNSNGCPTSRFWDVGSFAQSAVRLTPKLSS